MQNRLGLFKNKDWLNWEAYNSKNIYGEVQLDGLAQRTAGKFAHGKKDSFREKEQRSEQNKGNPMKFGEIWGKLPFLIVDWHVNNTILYKL